MFRREELLTVQSSPPRASPQSHRGRQQAWSRTTDSRKAAQVIHERRPLRSRKRALLGLKMPSQGHPKSMAVLDDHAQEW